MRAYVSRLKLHCFPTRRSSDLVMQAMSDTETPQGVLATLPLPDVRPPEDFAFALVSDAVSDPGNLGTIMRAKAKDRKSTRLNSSHVKISYAVFCLKKKNNQHIH